MLDQPEVAETKIINCIKQQLNAALDNLIFNDDNKVNRKRIIEHKINAVLSHMANQVVNYQVSNPREIKRRHVVEDITRIPVGAAPGDLVFDDDGVCTGVVIAKFKDGTGHILCCDKDHMIPTGEIVVDVKIQPSHSINFVNLCITVDTYK